MSALRQMLIQPRMWVILILGYASGLPLNLSDATIKAWYSEAGVDIVTIGFLSLVGLPYALKFFWAPLLDRFLPPFAGRRRGWVILFQLGLVIMLAAFACFEPQEHAGIIASLALGLAFCSASLDIVIDAYRIELLPKQELGMGAAFALGGYRIGMLVSGGLALIFADWLGWSLTFLILSLTLVGGIVCAWFAPEPESPSGVPSTLLDAIVDPLKELWNRANMLAFLGFIVLFKLGDAFTSSLTPTFLLRGLEFSLTEVGVATKIFGMAAAIIGIALGGIVLTKLGMVRALLLCGTLQALANFQFYILATVGHHLPLMYATLFIEYLFVGMGNAAIVAFIMALCDKRYTATQFAFFSAIAAVARIMAGPASGYLIKYLGWAHFYLLTFALALPCVFLLWMLRRRQVFQIEDKPAVAKM